MFFVAPISGKSYVCLYTTGKIVSHELAASFEVSSKHYFYDGRWTNERQLRISGQ
jgi:hypothetical protein